MSIATVLKRLADAGFFSLKGGRAGRGKAMRFIAAVHVIGLGCVLSLWSAANAAIYSPQRALAAPIIQQFLSDPASLLGRYPVGGPKMVAMVRDLAASDPATLKPIVDLLGVATADQATAIGSGLGQAATMAVKTDQAFANRPGSDRQLGSARSSGP